MNLLTNVCLWPQDDEAVRDVIKPVEDGSASGGDASGEEDAAIDEELAFLSGRRHQQQHPDSLDPNHENVEDCCCRLVAMASAGKTATGASPASTASTTPQPGAVDQDDDAKTLTEDEERDSFHIEEVAAQGPRSLPYTRSVPLLHHCLTPPRSLAVGKCNNPGTLLLHIHPRLQPSPYNSPCTAPPSTPQQQSLPPVPMVPVVSHHHQDLESESRKMSRSISDSTLRRAALHLNLSQSVLPSFTSIQQFKVFFGV